MTKKITISRRQIRIIITDHFLQRLEERNILPENIALTPGIIDNILGNRHSKHILKNTIHNFSIVLKSQNNAIKFITAISGTDCRDNSANIFVLA